MTVLSHYCFYSLEIVIGRSISFVLVTKKSHPHVVYVHTHTHVQSSSINESQLLSSILKCFNVMCVSADTCTKIFREQHSRNVKIVQQEVDCGVWAYDVKLPRKRGCLLIACVCCFIDNYYFMRSDVLPKTSTSLEWLFKLCLYNV